MIDQIFSKVRRVRGALRVPDVHRLTDDDFVDFAYQFILRRQVDTKGRLHYVRKLESGEISRQHIMDALVDSTEFAAARRYSNLLTSLHESRMRFVRSLPRAEHIVDLGGTSQDSDNGAFVDMGYPYPFTRLTIVDLPIEDRHNLYKNSKAIAGAQTSSGEVHYLYRSMVDLAPIPSGSIDLVYSGQSIEHITPADAKLVFQEVRRILKPNGFFCLDTPNGRVTRLQQSSFIDPEHKVEYTHAQLSGALAEAGFVIQEAKGLNYAGTMNSRWVFNATRVAQQCGIYDDIENCYLLAYVCRNS